MELSGAGEAVKPREEGVKPRGEAVKPRGPLPHAAGEHRSSHPHTSSYMITWVLQLMRTDRGVSARQPSANAC